MGIDGGFGVVSWNEDDDGIGLVDFGLLYDVFLNVHVRCKLGTLWPCSSDSGRRLWAQEQDEAGTTH